MGSEVGRGGTGPLSVCETLRKDPEFVLRPRKLGFLNLEDLTELDEGLISSPPVSNDASLSVDLFFSLVKGEVLLVVESCRTPEFGNGDEVDGPGCYTCHTREIC
jgi:hypothetical protein